VCPAFEQVTVVRKRKSKVDLPDDIALPDPRPVHAAQEAWRCFIAGVGGMGVGVLTSVLSAAGGEVGYTVQFVQHKGIAVRTGGVFGEVVFTTAAGGRPPRDTSAITPFGGADLLLGVDPLEAVRSIDPEHPHRVVWPDRTAAVVNGTPSPTVLQMTGSQPLDLDSPLAVLQRYVMPGHYLEFPIADVCERITGSKQYAAVALLGLAYQRGYVPVPAGVLERAIIRILADEAAENLRAFSLGRMLAVQPGRFAAFAPSSRETPMRTLRRKAEALRDHSGSKRQPRDKCGKELSRQFRLVIRDFYRDAKGLSAHDPLLRQVVTAAYDCVIWGGLDCARDYCRRVLAVFHKDDRGRNHAITRAAARQLAKVMLIKDEVYVAAMLTSPDKYARDRHRFGVDPAAGDRLTYRHLCRAEFELFGKRLGMDLVLRDWQLRIVARMRFLRHVVPGWHLREREFAAWYQGVLERMSWTDDADGRDYQRWLAIVRTPETVSGFRDVRYPKMAAARRRAEQLLALAPGQFTLPQSDAAAEPHRRISLPVLAAPSPA
jgi:indolepyruvate ferredoxin oxidoreductase